MGAMPLCMGGVIIWSLLTVSSGWNGEKWSSESPSVIIVLQSALKKTGALQWWHPYMKHGCKHVTGWPDLTAAKLVVVKNSVQSRQQTSTSQATSKCMVRRPLQHAALPDN